MEVLGVYGIVEHKSTRKIAARALFIGKGLLLLKFDNIVCCVDADMSTGKVYMSANE